MNGLQKQRGAVLLVGLIILMAAMAAGLMAVFSQKMAATRKEITTAQVLAQAKSALLGFASANNNPTASVSSSRPGDLPCPDLSPLGSVSEGTAATSCSANALGRLPWKTLGLPDLRDAWGERLWYAVSTRFKNNPRLFPLNPDTAYGQISLRANDGVSYLFKAASPAESGSGAVALIIAPGAPIKRADNLQQNRNAANYLIPQHYLDCWGTAGCNVEDNADFLDDSATNGFVAGPIRLQDREIVNDRIVAISRSEMLSAMLLRVATMVSVGLETFYGQKNWLPAPAAIGNYGCLGRFDVSTTCPAVILPALTFGRLPAQPGGAFWSGLTRTDFLTGSVSASNASFWFQQNAWREHVFYAITPACAAEAPGCLGSLTVNNPPYAPVNGKRAVIIVGGAALNTQQRLTNPQKIDPFNYLEEQNFTFSDFVFARRPVSAATSFNDVVATVPRLP